MGHGADDSGRAAFPAASRSHAPMSAPLDTNLAVRHRHGNPTESRSNSQSVFHSDQGLSARERRHSAGEANRGPLEPRHPRCPQEPQHRECFGHHPRMHGGRCMDNEIPTNPPGRRTRGGVVGARDGDALAASPPLLLPVRRKGQTPATQPAWNASATLCCCRGTRPFWRSPNGQLGAPTPPTNGKAAPSPACE